MASDSTIIQSSPAVNKGYGVWGLGCTMRFLYLKPYTLYPLAIGILLIASLNACAPTVNDPGTPNALVATPDTVRLAGLAASGSVSLHLNCGCPFIFDSVRSTGDT